VIGAAFRDTLAEAKAGDEAAFTRLFRDVQPALLRYLRLIAPDADDVASDTWLQVVGGLERFRGEEQEFRAWLFTIARHRAADSGRSRARRPAVPLEMTEAEQRPTASDTADQALEAVSTRAVLELIATLPGDQAEIILLRVVAGLEAREVARIVGKSPGAVRVAAHRGLRKLASLTPLPDTERAGTRPGVTH
jgi:RNA polymerase sigma-70 factor (ECF subfamily)